jgi:autotransporter-associated beta strand protein
MGTFNFNGGTLIAGTAAIADFMNNLDVVTVQSPGARIDTNGQTVAINQALLDGGGNGGLTKLGAGFLQLNGACTFTGTTTVTAGSLGGTGSVAGPLVVNSGTTFAPGASVGTFAAGPTTLAGTYACEINGDVADKLVVNGTLATSAGSLVITELAAPTAAVYIIASYTGATPAPFASVTGLPTGYTLNYAYNDGSTSTNIALVGEDAYGMWAKTNITDINPSADATPSGDPDGDGAKNLTEFALNGSPLSAATSGKVVGKIAKVADSSTLVLTVPVRSAATFSGTTEQVSNSIDGVIYKIQASDTLATWDLAVSEVTGDDKTAIEASLPALGAGWTYRTFQSPGVVAGDPTDFMRAVIVKP